MKAVGFILAARRETAWCCAACPLWRFLGLRFDDEKRWAVGFFATHTARWATTWRCVACPLWSFLGLRFDDEKRYAWDRGLLQVWAIGLKSRHVSRWTELSVGQLVPWWWRSVFARFLASGSPGMSTQGGRWASGDVDSFWGIFGAIFLVRLGLGCRMGWGRLWGRVEGVDLHVLQRGWGDATITSWVNIFKTSSHSFQKTWKWERKEFDSEQIQLLCYLYKQLLNSVLIYFLFIFPLFCHTESESLLG